MASQESKDSVLGAAWEWLKNLSPQQVQRGLDDVATATAFVPGVGDAIGLTADVNRLARNPEERTPLNFGLAALGALPFVPPLGMLRKGGREDLMPWHGTKVSNLQDVMADKGELYSPSIGISKEIIPPTWTAGHSSVTLIPKVGALDPATYPTTLFNRDAYTPRKEWYEGMGSEDPMEFSLNLQEALDAGETMESIRRTQAQLRNADRTRGGPGLRGLEREDFWSPKSALDRGLALGDLVAGVGSVPHAVAIKGSPSFPSFKNYEKHPLGANLLDKRFADKDGAALFAEFNNGLLTKFFPETGRLDALRLGDSLVDYDRARRAHGGREKLLEAVDQPGGLAGISVPGSMVEQVNDNPQDFIKSLDKYHNALVKSPSEYAELKAAGPIPVNSEHWAGAMFPQGPEPGVDVRAQLAEALLAKGVPSASAWLPPLTALDPAARSALRFQLADELQRQAGHARRSPL